jgi:NADPH:quinone reductase-like Zn-dependent oxidoreductase
LKAYELREPTGIDALHINGSRTEPKPGAGQILIRMRAASLNFRDHGVTRGAYGYTKFPVIPLSDGAGEVVEVGSEVTRFKAGDRVVGTFFQTWHSGEIPQDASKNSLGGNRDGVLAEYIVLPENGAIRFPDHLSFQEAATLPCAALTAWHALIEGGKLKAGETVVVLGTGGVSIFALQIAKLHNARVILTSSSDEKLTRARQLGADVGINYRSIPEWEQEVLTLTDGKGADHVIEVGGPGTLEKSMAAVRPGGLISVIGAVSGAGAINPRSINRKSLRLHGIHVGSREMFTSMTRAIETSKLRPAIDSVFPFADAKQAYAHQASGAHLGKIVIDVA